ncbi:hypothetical protein F5I97DRAFT_1930981 [Phlebopus sp. FC_14]|nr:hypothetical protein F5I97DRAFT_1930981 [Phlebopus sp. FC_14]
MSQPPILNPLVYLNFLPADLGAQYEVFRNVHIAALGAYVGDMLSTLPQDVKMMRSSKLTLSIFAYWTARYLTLVVFGTTGPLDNCRAGLRGIDASYDLAGAATSFLFLRRVHAVFFDGKAVRWCFTALWLASIVVWAVGSVGSDAFEIADTKHCMPTEPPHTLIVGPVMPLTYDSLVFLAISYKIVTSYSHTQCPLTLRTFFSQPLSHRLPRSILLGSQKYYLVSVCANVIVVVLFSLRSVPPLYQGIAFVPTSALTSSMACRVFRNLFLQDIEAEGGDKSPGTVMLTSIVCPTGVTSGQGIDTSSRALDQDAPHAVV